MPKSPQLNAGIEILRTAALIKPLNCVTVWSYLKKSWNSEYHFLMECDDMRTHSFVCGLQCFGELATSITMVENTY
jgi:hypothetical protein